jgi:hypothetical protein
MPRYHCNPALFPMGALTQIGQRPSTIKAGVGSDHGFHPIPLGVWGEKEKKERKEREKGEIVGHFLCFVKSTIF